MKKLFFFLFVCMVSVYSKAQIGDAFKGIWPVTDKAMMKSLNGEWLLKVTNGIDSCKEVPTADASWRSIPVPGCWESLRIDGTSGMAYSFCKPTYSFPDSLTGYYRTQFNIPAAWKGQRVIIRLDGVLRGYDLWLNDHYVGTWESAYNTCLFDLTPYLTKKAFKGEPQQLAMRVYSRFKGFEFDCFDDWAPMGIHRDVTLFVVPKTHLSDLTVTTKINGEVNVTTQIANATKQATVNYEIYDALGHLVSTDGQVQNPRLWTAETPYLYHLCVYLKEKGKVLQTFRQKIGFREVGIDGNVLKVNGQPVKLRGVTCHATDPVTVKVVSDDLTLKDMRLMKEASVNYIRTSHYPREPRFYELCDSLGFYVVNEVAMGSRGEKNLSKPDYQDIMRTRVAATMPRDKNHPSVIVWSIGNENPLPITCQALGEYAKTFDPTRPICYPQKGSYFRSVGFEKFPKVADIYAPHYPTTGQLRDYYTKTDRPLIFTEYCHTLGISFEDHDRQWEIIEHTPGIAGGSVWEWVDQGMPFKVDHPAFSKWRTDGSERDQKVYTSEDGGFEMKGNFGTDGLLYADRTPLPNYYELQHNYARAFVSIEQSTLNIQHPTAPEVAANNGQSSMVNGQSSMVNGQSSMVNGQCHNRYDFLNLKDNVTFHWALTNNRDTVATGSFSPDCPPRSTVPYTLPLTEQPQGLSLLHFDIEDSQGHTFLHQSFVLNKPGIEWRGTGDPMQMVQKGPLVRTGRKATMAERITQKGRLPAKYLLPLNNQQVKADIQTENVENGIGISFTLTPDTADVFRAELGLAYLLDPRIDRVQWIGQGPFASYPGRHQACRYGFWAKHKDDLYFEGNHGGVDAALFSDAEGNGILVVGDSLDLNFEQTDLGIVLTINAAVSGQGPKFAKTAFPGWQKSLSQLRGPSFRLYRVEAGKMTQAVARLFDHPQNVPAPFKPFLTQYDTYLLKFNDIYDQRSANIVFIGNSITYGALHNQRELTAPPVQCASWLSQQEGIDTVYIKNCGRSGKTTYHFLPRAEDVVPAGDKTYFPDVVSQTRELVKAHPTLPLVFSIMLGTNDTVERPRNKHTSPNDYADNLCTIIDSLLTLWPDAHIVLNKPIWYTPDYVTKNGSVASKKSLELLNAYYKVFPQVVSRCKPGHVHIGDSEAFGYFSENWRTDINEEKDSRGRSYWLHPNEQGARHLAEFWGRAILPILLP